MYLKDITDKLISCNLKLVFTSYIRVNSSFAFIDKSLYDLPGFVNKYKCGGCNTYCGKTKHCFKDWICEHFGISHLTRKKVRIDNNRLTAIQEHLLFFNCFSFFEYFPILITYVNDFKQKIMENLLIHVTSLFCS